MNSKFILPFSKIFPFLFSYPNTHQGPEKAFKKRLSPSLSIWLRPTFSDQARFRELKDNIYTQENYLFELVVSKQPTVLLDIGANIGLSTYALLNKLPSIKLVIGIEAESLNYEMLCRNYDEYRKKFANIIFMPIHAIASSENREMAASVLQGGLSKSGIFRYIPLNDNRETPVANQKKDHNPPCVLIIDLLNQAFIAHKNKVKEGGLIVCKLDIEGGEEFLLASNTEWLNSTIFLTAEIHDRFSKATLDSSANLLKCISDNNFAICPEKDVLMCYNRNLLG